MVSFYDKGGFNRTIPLTAPKEKQKQLKKIPVDYKDEFKEQFGSVLFSL